VWIFFVDNVAITNPICDKEVSMAKTKQTWYHYPTWGDNTYDCLSIGMNFLQLFHRILFVAMMCEIFLPFQQLKYMFIIKQWTNKWSIIFF